jgi:hypothetical protein
MLSLKELKAHYNNEQIVLVLLARTYFDELHKPDTIAFIADNTINWPYLMKITRAHGLRSFAYYVITHHQIVVDSVFLSKLKLHYEHTRMQNLRLAVQTSRLISAFKEKGITVIPYKGVLFAQNYYADIAIRESSDIDFLVEPRHVNQIENYFIDNGYTAKISVPKSFLSYYKRFFKDIVYVTPGPANKVSVEIHWRLMERFSGAYPQFDFLLPHLKPSLIGAVAVTRLSPTYDLLAVASNHFVKDMSVKFKYLVDMAALIHKEKESLDETVIFKTANEYGFRNKMEMGLSLLNDLLGVTLLHNPKRRYNASKYIKIPLAFPLHLPRLYINEPEFIKRSMHLQDTFWLKIKLAFKLLLYVFLPTFEDINQSKLPAYLLPLLIISRPFRLFKQAVKPKKARTAGS